jgi:hypothetical protein
MAPHQFLQVYKVLVLVLGADILITRSLLMSKCC